MFWYSIIKTEEKQRLERLKVFENVTPMRYGILKQAWPEFLKEIIKSVQMIQNDLLKKMTKSRDLSAIIYADGASDFADKLKFELKQALWKIVADPNLYDPVTGKSINTWKNK